MFSFYGTLFFNIERCNSNEGAESASEREDIGADKAETDTGL